MPTSKPSKAFIVKILGQWEKAGRPTIADFAARVKQPESTVRRWLTTYPTTYGITIKKPADKKYTVDSISTVKQEDVLRDRVKQLESVLSAVKQNTLDENYIKDKIIKLVKGTEKATAPKWLVQTTKTKSTPGVPTLLASDWHWGERVFRTQVGGVNEYDMQIAQARARALVTNAIDLLNNHMVNPNYPGIVFALGGDMVSGGIHEELLATDQQEIMPVVLDLFSVLCWAIKTLADEFGNVFVPCVSGNHGRSTKKIRAKGRNFTSYDWLLYQFLSKFFADDKRVTFLIPDGSDCAYSVYSHRYLLTHGDQARGGDGVIGMLGPVIRMDHRKRSRATQLDMSYDTMLLGHFHTLTQLRRLIINGSLKGYCEYAFANNFGFEPPQQALWITHPTRGITFSMPVHVEKPKIKTGADWVAFKKGS